MENTLPRWSLTAMYTGFDDPAFLQDFATAEKEGSALEQLLLEEPVSKERWLVQIVQGVNELLDRYENLSAYAYARYSTNTRDEAALKGMGQTEELGLLVQRIEVLMKKRLGALFTRERLSKVAEAGDYGYVLGLMIESRQFLMSREEEELASDLERSGAEAWKRLHAAVTSTASALWSEQPGGEQVRKSATQLRALSFSPDREIRRKAFNTELELWEKHKLPLAAAINGVKGSVLSLCERRGYRDPLHAAVKESRLTEQTLESLITVMEESLPVFQGYLKQKAHLLGLDALAFFDLFAPVGRDPKQWSFPEAREFIIEQFSAFHPGMGAFAENAFDSGWIDAEPRDGKTGGAYCIGFPLARESRVFSNFNGSFSTVSTLAHELGHAYHGHILRNQPALLSDYPMPLAETASIFAETVTMSGALKNADSQERLVIIEEYLQKSTQVIVDILSRFYFERELFSRRKKGELTPGELNEIMADAQQRCYGEGLDRQQLHPTMWAVKPHYYIPGNSFYNFPYAFGQLFGLGLFARYEAEGESFRALYDAILLETGKSSALSVASLAGYDIEQPDFWRNGIGMIHRFTSEFEEITKQGSSWMHLQY